MAVSMVLSDQDGMSLLELIYECRACTAEEDIRKLVGKLRNIISYEFAICGLGKFDAIQGAFLSNEVININYPSEWLEQYVIRKWNQIDPILRENFTQFTLQYWQDTFKKFPPRKDFLSISRDFGLIHGYTHGARNFRDNEGCFFSLSGRYGKRCKRTEMVLEMIFPHLCQALTRILSKYKQKDNVTLSKREKEILRWVAHGKSSWDTSIILGISERTVYFHMGNIMHKLNAVNRIQAIAIAAEHKLIPMDHPR